ncbi:MAG: large subunit ribosomal protein [Patescibacteria group bacterium]|nr:large subunit ribosomal protein [Patescibacteria group bacterium]
MSRLGKLPIKLPTGVSANLADNFLVVKGPKGEMRVAINPLIEIKIDNNEIQVTPFKKEEKKISAIWGLLWSLTRNAVIGVSEGFSKKLEINGVGYRAAVAGNKLNMNLGFSHPIEFILPVGITASVEGNVITIFGVDKQVVGEVAASIRKIRKPEPYKGKGIKYSDEVIRRKAGKAATKGK